MTEINKFLTFIQNNLDDDRVSLHKEMKFGVRHYYISIEIEKIKDTSSQFPGRSFNELSVVIDNRNKCISMNNTHHDRCVTIENEELVKKWSEIFENYLNQNIERNIKDMIHETMSNAKDKDLYRGYQMEKIFKDNEPI